MKHFDERFSDKVAALRAGEMTFEGFADWCEEQIAERRRKAEYLIKECYSEAYLEYAEREVKKSREAIEHMERGFQCIIDFIDGGAEELLDEAVPHLQASVASFLEALELNDECLELSGGFMETA